MLDVLSKHEDLIFFETQMQRHTKLLESIMLPIKVFVWVTDFF
jgi:hypothetical protein